MLEIRTTCENCQRVLPNNSDEAMICSYECTFCRSCVDNILFNVCPNCGGGFEKRPTRPHEQLAKFPVREDKVYQPVDEEKFVPLREKNRSVPPRKR